MGVREYLGCLAAYCVGWGEPYGAYTDYEGQMSRVQLHGLDLGAAYRSPQFVQIVEHLAAVVARARTADALNRNLASVGVASFVRAPGPIWKKTLRSDGAGTHGGEDAQHKSTGAAELFWKSLHPNHAPEGNMPVEWELFHCVSLVFDKTIADIPCACEIFEVLQSIGALFGVGDGRVILRGAADQIGERRSRVPDQGGSRKVIALANTIEHLLNNQKTFHAAMHARIAQSESKAPEGRTHRGGQRKNALTRTGRRISALNSTVLFSRIG